MKKKSFFETLEEANNTTSKIQGGTVDKDKLNKLVDDLVKPKQRQTNVNTEELFFTSLERSQNKRGGKS